MESEKVKEIKNNLNTEIKLAELNKTRFTELISVDLIKDILTLINELESENKRLLEQRNKTYNIWIKDTEELKDRIAELEESIEKWQRKAINYYQRAKSYGIECIIDNDIDELLKEFEK